MKLIPIHSSKAHIQRDMGGKASNLSILASEDLPVPEGWVVPLSAFDDHLTRCGVASSSSQMPPEPSEELLRDIRSHIISKCLDRGLLSSLSNIPKVTLAVRSSSSVEDQTAGSYSGLFETILGVNGTEALVDAVKRVWASVFTSQVLAYHSRINPEMACPRMAVLIMPIVAAEVAGVICTANPASGNPLEIAISACRGPGSTVVDGSESCDEYLLDWDSLKVKEARQGAQQKGTFLRNGCISTRAIRSSQSMHPVCSEKSLRRLAKLACLVDDLFGARMDVEFAFAGDEVLLLQARPLVGLPAFFPDNPEEADARVHRSGSGERLVLAPFSQAILRQDIRPTTPPPPWPVEVGALIVKHGQLFYRESEEPDDASEKPWEDRTFVSRMMELDKPADDLLEARQWARMVYTDIIPALRSQAEEVLRHSRQSLRDMSSKGLSDIVGKVLYLCDECIALYVSASKGTYEVLRRIDILVRDWITGPDYRESQPIAHTTIQGAPKLTHRRDSELESVADGTMSQEDYACRWGYGYLEIEDMMDISRWLSWREDMTPVRVAVSLLRKRSGIIPFHERLSQSVEQSDRAFQAALMSIGGSGQEQTQHRREVFSACVEAGRIVFPLKDDRDIVNAHGQSALRWVLMEVGRRLVVGGSVTGVEDVFLLKPQEIMEWLHMGKVRGASVRTLIDDRRQDQKRMARYTLSTHGESNEKAEVRTGHVLVGRPASIGSVQGLARVVDSIVDVEALQPGEILCLLGERRVGWTMFFPTIAGLAYEYGNWLCHEANLCRELSIPAVVALGGQIRGIQTGEILNLDGTEGTVIRPSPSS